MQLLMKLEIFSSLFKSGVMILLIIYQIRDVIQILVLLIKVNKKKSILNKGNSSDDFFLYRFKLFTSWLHIAIDRWFSDPSIIKIILEYGDDPIIKDDQVRTALHIAIQVKNEEILHYPYKHDQRNNS